MQINPDFEGVKLLWIPLLVSIVSIHADQSRLEDIFGEEPKPKVVSIVSIHADQSRRYKNAALIEGNLNVSIVSIHADQSRPVSVTATDHRNNKVSIVSIHADQSRLSHFFNLIGSQFGFNRINSCRSIPTCVMEYRTY